jgi:hypothetical protein
MAIVLLLCGVPVALVLVLSLLHAKRLGGL